MGILIGILKIIHYLTENGALWVLPIGIIGFLIYLDIDSAVNNDNYSNKEQHYEEEDTI